ncbi:hypothetical protein ACLOJK_039351 [Asimina triloba]
MELAGTLGNDDEHCHNGKVEDENAGGGHRLANSCNETEEAHGTLVSAAESNKNRKSSKCNLRKSLAWDNAFFTSEGILDPDELENVSKTSKKSQLCALPGIQEDLRKSTESTTTLGSDASALESLEVELFEDIRASIQKSGYDSGRTSDTTLSRSKAGQREPSMACPMKPVSKPLIAYKRQSLSKQALEKNPKEVLVHPRAVTASSGELNSSLKPPKVLTKVNPPSTRPTKPSVAPTKKILPSSECIKTKNNVTKDMGISPSPSLMHEHKHLHRGSLSHARAQTSSHHLHDLLPTWQPVCSEIFSLFHAISLLNVSSAGNGSNQRSSVPSKKPVLGAEPSVPASSIPSPTSSCSSGSSRSAKTMPTTPSSTKKSGITKTLRNRIVNHADNLYQNLASHLHDLLPTWQPVCLEIFSLFHAISLLNVSSAGNGSNQRSSVPSKKPGLGAEPSVPGGSIPSPASSCSSGSSRSAKTMPTTPSSTKKSGITKTLRKKIVSRNSNPPSKDLIIKTPLRSSKIRMESGTSHLTANVIFASKVSPNISPASSIDGFSSESSSSTCTASQMSDSSKASLDISCASSRGGDLLMRTAEPPDETHIGQQSSFQGQSVERASFENGILSHPAAANGSGTCTNYKSMQKFKPSGLRMPSPKIGFFDAEKNGVRASNAGLQFYSGLQSGLPKKNASGINSLDGALKQRPSKLQHAKPLTQFGTMKFSSHVTGPSNQAYASSLKPAYRQHPQQLSSLSPEPSGTPKTKSHLNTNVVVQDSSATTSRETKSKTRELQSDEADKGKYSKTANMNVEEHGDQNVITRNILVESNNKSTLEKSISLVPSPVTHSKPATKLAEENFDSMNLKGEHVVMGQKENITENNYNASPVPQQLISLH